MRQCLSNIQYWRKYRVLTRLPILAYGMTFCPYKSKTAFGIQFRIIDILFYTPIICLSDAVFPRLISRGVNMFIKTFLVGLLLTFKAARAYCERNQDGIKAHMSDVDYMHVLNAIDAITAVIDLLIGSPIVGLGARVSKTNPEYLAAVSNLSKGSDDFIRLPARVVRRGDAV